VSRVGHVPRCSGKLAAVEEHRDVVWGYQSMASSVLPARRKETLRLWNRNCVDFVRNLLGTYEDSLKVNLRQLQTLPLGKRYSVGRRR